jgi:hypothetical protein
LGSSTAGEPLHYATGSATIMPENVRLSTFGKVKANLDQTTYLSMMKVQLEATHNAGLIASVMQR